MKLLLASDLHADLDATRSLVERSAGFDAVVLAGDFGNMRKGVGRCISVLQAVKCAALLVPGNNESAEELTDACRGWPAAHVLHGTTATVNGVTFYGVGGGIPVTPFGPWSYDFTEEEATELLAACPPGCVLVTHSPPKGCVDVSGRGKSIGSTTVADAIRRVRPRLVVCGHVHASGGQTGTLDGVPVVNAGPTGVEWELA